MGIPIVENKNGCCSFFIFLLLFCFEWNAAHRYKLLLILLVSTCVFQYPIYISLCLLNITHHTHIFYVTFKRMLPAIASILYFFCYSRIFLLFHQHSIDHRRKERACFQCAPLFQSFFPFNFLFDENLFSSSYVNKKKKHLMCTLLRNSCTHLQQE